MSTNIPWEKILGDGWARLMNSYLHSEEMQNIMNQVSRSYNNSVVYPSKVNLFRAFRLTPLEDLKVVILGQDPYHQPGRATGLAFANPEGVYSFSPSLASIHRAIEEYSDAVVVDFDPTLESWSRQGVLLINSALTVQKAKPGSHTGLWKPFIKEVISRLNSEKTGLHFCWWGGHAKEFSKLVKSIKHYNYFAPHPVAHMYSNAVNKWECDHFKLINDKIRRTNGEEGTITWENYSTKRIPNSRPVYKQQESS